ncbi:tetratricopeptide repeat-containing sulfotransferase family protein [Thermomonas sp. HDW16]|uniref:tetratricopeptide repeat-containing sulfotransferase family protein n=1 Tax=Thermomonas sp. HDW16 TaxID=2714945 RepID=UPI00140BDFB9|nr:tetratricopeptide repeat-containing sulfotransferase family protein [Thermomonas sp. HDW16]QIL21167.1 tetratricopeptide repeat protein [Thermomonas sp. HDW16]
MDDAQQTTSVDAALTHAMRLLAQDPGLAAEQARQILLAVPGDPGGRLVLGMAQGAQGAHTEALSTLEPLAAEQPAAARVHLELGIVLAALHRHDDAIASIEHAVRLRPDLPGAWLGLASLLDAAGQRKRAAAAYLMHARNGKHDPDLMAAALALNSGDLPAAEQRLRDRLRARPDDVAAMRMLAELGARIGRNEQALGLLEHCLQLAPGFAMARHNYALVLDRCNRHEDALVEVESLLALDEENPNLQNLKAVVLGKLGNYGSAIRLYESILDKRPKEPRVWMSLGHALKTEGRTDRAVIAYRRAIELNPAFGGAWWSLANLKTVRFDAGDIAAMQQQLQHGDLDDDQRLHFEFALGKALEDTGEYAASFAHYASGNALRRKQLPYDAGQNTQRKCRAQATYTREFFAERAGVGHDDPAPVFIVGMPRAGSTLIEQILSSHPQVEATMELPDIIAITRDLRAKVENPETTSYHDIVAGMDPAEFKELGERYIERTRVQRKQGRPFFIDKMPNNFAHVGLIQLILPNARIIDARRHPLACGFSNFKQHFARGQNFSYDLTDMGRYYADYVALMAHFDAVLPGRVHRVIYEDMVTDTETQVRALLDYCGLEFDERCLRFFENDRAVRTASSEQVRRPIYRDGVDQWRHFEPWLDPLKQALGPVLEHYPAVPDAGQLPA